jgi:hypothetical protein
MCPLVVLCSFESNPNEYKLWNSKKLDTLLITVGTAPILWITSTPLQRDYVDMVFQSSLGQIDDVAVMGEENHL